MITIPAAILCAVFVVLAAVHVYWAFGGGRSLGNVVPTKDGAPVFVPGKAATRRLRPRCLPQRLSRCGELGLSIGPELVPRVGIWVIAVVFALRAVGDFHYCGLFKRVRDTAFARYDTLVYSPLCVVIAALAVWLSASG